MKGVNSSALLWCFRMAHDLVADRAGNISIVVAASLPVFIVVLGLSFEVAQWNLAQRAMQNAADSASMAASISSGGNPELEARAVAAQYGYVHGTDNVTVSVASGLTCPSGASNCHQVTISKPTPLYLIGMIGYKGNVTVDGQSMVQLSSGATAESTLRKREYCILTLAGLPGQSSTEGFRCNGCPMADLSGCNIMSNNTATCVGFTTHADVGDAYSINNGCGVRQNSYQPPVEDPYDGLAAHIPPDPCGGSYPQIPVRKTDPPLPSTNEWSGPRTINGTMAGCGDLQLTGAVDITNSLGDGGVLIIWNGRLDTNGHTFRTVTGHLTTCPSSEHLAQLAA